MAATLRHRHTNPTNPNANGFAGVSASAGGAPAGPTSSTESCVVCLDPLLNRRLAHLPCEHHFHETCISLWARAQPFCPLCRAPFALADLVYTLNGNTVPAPAPAPAPVPVVGSEFGQRLGRVAARLRDPQSSFLDLRGVLFRFYNFVDRVSLTARRDHPDSLFKACTGAFLIWLLYPFVLPHAMYLLPLVVCYELGATFAGWPRLSDVDIANNPHVIGVVNAAPAVLTQALQFTFDTLSWQRPLISMRVVALLVLLCRWPCFPITLILLLTLSCVFLASFARIAETISQRNPSWTAALTDLQHRVPLIVSSLSLLVGEVSLTIRRSFFTLSMINRIIVVSAVILCHLVGFPGVGFSSVLFLFASIDLLPSFSEAAIAAAAAAAAPAPAAAAAHAGAGVGAGAGAGAGGASH